MRDWIPHSNGPGAREANEVRSQEARPTHSPDGVDLTVIRWMLSLTPAERLRVLQKTIRSIMRLRGNNRT